MGGGVFQHVDWLRTIAIRMGYLFACCAMVSCTGNSNLNSVMSYKENSNRKAASLYSFEQGHVPSVLSCKNSCTSLTDYQYKDGSQSLKWQVSDDDSLTLNYSADISNSVTQISDGLAPAFYTWLYNPVAVDDSLRVAFFNGEKEIRYFEYGLNFTGWRAILVPYLTEMYGQGELSFDKIQLQYPKLRANTDSFLLLDHWIPVVNVDARWPLPDYQIRLHEEVARAPNAHWNAVLQYDDWRKANASNNSVHTNSSQQIEQISHRIEQQLLSNVSVDEHSFAALLLSLQNAQVSTSLPENLKWKPVFFVRHHELLSQGRVNSNQLQWVKQNSLYFRDAGRLLLSIAQHYHKTTLVRQRKLLLVYFESLAKHLREQGFAEGSGLGNMHHQGYSIREWADAIFLMREVLPGLSATVAEDMAWFAGLGRIYRPEAEIVGFNVDVMNTFLPAMLYAALLQPIPETQYELVRQLSKWVSYSLTHHQGLAGGIQSDSAFFHHSQHYVAYGNGGLLGLAPVIYYLSQSDFAISEQAFERVKKALLLSAVFSNERRIPLSLSGRHPDGKQSIVVEPFQFLARARSVPDRELASLYLALSVDKDPRIVREFKAAGITPAKTPTGAWAVNTSSLLLYRQQNWLLSARGFNRYLVSHESYGNANLYGRYINYGQIEVMPEKADLRGFRESGWNWNHWPGTTSIILPLAKLKAQLFQVDKFAGIEEMLLAEETFSGANVLSDDAAMFAMSLRGHAKYAPSFRAKKSLFVFGNKAVALGSDIHYADPDFPVQTTLLQVSREAESLGTSIRLDGVTLEQAPFEQVFYSDAFTRLDDHLGIAYFVAPGQALQVARRNQHSRDNKNSQDTEGEFTTAWIDHGHEPKASTYHYSMLIGASEEEKSAFALQLHQPDTAPYTVIQQDSTAHIVRDNQRQEVGMAIYDASQPLLSEVIKSVDKPAMLMFENDETLTMTVVNPDLALYEGLDSDQYDEHGLFKEVSIYSRPWRTAEFQETKLSVTVWGQWALSAPSEVVTVMYDSDGNTRLQITCLAGQPVKFDLTPIR